MQYFSHMFDHGILSLKSISYHTSEEHTLGDAHAGQTTTFSRTLLPAHLLLVFAIRCS